VGAGDRNCSILCGLCVFHQPAIEAAGIESPRDFVAMVPNMTLVGGAEPSATPSSPPRISQARQQRAVGRSAASTGCSRPIPKHRQGANRHPGDRGAEGSRGRLVRSQAIGGAILIHTVDPSASLLSARGSAGQRSVRESPGGTFSGPIDSAGTRSMRIAQLQQH